MRKVAHGSAAKATVERGADPGAEVAACERDATPSERPLLQGSWRRQKDAS